MFFKQLCIKIPKNTLLYCLKYNKFILVFKNKFTILFFKDADRLIFCCVKKNMLILYFKLTNFKKTTSLCTLLKNNLVELLAKKSVFETKSLKLVGIGYKASLLKKNGQNILSLKLGYSHMIFIRIPKYIFIKISKQTIYLSCLNKIKLFKFCNIIKTLKLPDVYKGKGFFFEYEQLSLKKGKKA